MRHRRRFSLAALALVASVLCPRPALCQGTIPVSDLEAYSHTNGNKILVRAGVLHTVYSDLSDVFHRESINGNTWSAPSPPLGGLPGFCEQPTVAVDDDGTIGVAFICNAGIPNLYYVWKAKGSSTWTSPALIATNAEDPAMVSFGTDMHLAWHKMGVSQTHIEYSRFAANDPTNLSIEIASIVLGCSGIVEHGERPSIAVRAGTTPNTFEVFVGFTYFANNPCNISEPIRGGVGVRRRQSGGGWPDVYNGIGSVTGPFSHKETTLASNPAGEVYLGYSLGNTTGWTTIAKMINPSTSTWVDYQVTPDKTQIDIASDTAGSLRVVNSGSSVGCGAVTKRDFSWIGGLQPTQVSAASIAASGSDPQAIYFSNLKGCKQVPCRVDVAYLECTNSEIKTWPGCSSFVAPVKRHSFDESAFQGYDDSGHGGHGTVGGARPLVPGSGAGRLALGFQGTNNLPEFTAPHDSALNLGGPATGIAIIKPDGPHTFDNNPASCATGTIFTKGGNYWLQVEQNNSGLRFQQDGTQFHSASAPIPTDSWSHVAFVRDVVAGQFEVRLFLDGLPLGAPVTLSSTPVLDTSVFEVGNFLNGGCEFQGTIDEVKIYDFACSAADIAAEFEAANLSTPTEAEIPALSGWALVLLTIALGASAVILLIRRGRVSDNVSPSD